MGWIKTLLSKVTNVSDTNENGQSENWQFKCEAKDDISLPPNYTFAQAFNYLNSENNSFFILTSPKRDYIQCAGGRKRCAVELRKYKGNSYSHYVVGKQEPSGELTDIEMSSDPIEVYENEVLTRWEAIDLFDAFFNTQDLPSSYILRQVEL